MPTPDNNTIVANEDEAYKKPVQELKQLCEKHLAYLSRTKNNELSYEIRLVKVLLGSLNPTFQQSNKQRYDNFKSFASNYKDTFEKHQDSRTRSFFKAVLRVLTFGLVNKPSQGKMFAAATQKYIDKVEKSQNAKLAPNRKI